MHRARHRAWRRRRILPRNGGARTARGCVPASSKPGGHASPVREDAMGRPVRARHRLGGSHPVSHVLATRLSVQRMNSAPIRDVRRSLSERPAYRSSQTLRQPALLASLRRIAVDGAGAFYNGPIARRSMPIPPHTADCCAPPIWQGTSRCGWNPSVPGIGQHRSRHAAQFCGALL